MGRKAATTIACGIGLALSLLCALSMGPWENITLFGMNFFNLFDYVASNIRNSDLCATKHNSLRTHASKTTEISGLNSQKNHIFPRNHTPSIGAMRWRAAIKASASAWVL